METIDILMATYNGENYVENQIRSIMNQTYKNWILYISDDGSNDATKDIINRYSLLDQRIKVVPFKKCGGPKENFLYLLTFSKNKFVMFADQDDEWLPTKIENAYNIIKKFSTSNNPILVYSDLIVTDKELNTIDNSYFHYQSIKPNTNFKNLLTQNCITGCTMMFNDVLRKLTLKIKNVDNIIMHDWWMALIASAFGQIIISEKSLIKYRQHDFNSVGAKKGYGLNYLYIKLKNISDIQKALFNTRRQCSEFFDVFMLEGNEKLNDSSIYILSKEYGNLYNNKFKRMIIYIKYKVTKGKVFKTIALYLFG